MVGIELELGKDEVTGVCADCGSTTRIVRGFVNADGATRAAYVVRWTEGHLERGAQLLVGIGRWGEDASPSDRDCFALECRIDEDTPGFMLVDAERVMPGPEAMGRRLTRDEALQHPAKQELFAILDRLWEDDPRFLDFLLGNERAR